jgi:hypothetical protein
MLNGSAVAKSYGSYGFGSATLLKLFEICVKFYKYYVYCTVPIIYKD